MTPKTKHRIIMCILLAIGLVVGWQVNKKWSEAADRDIEEMQRRNLGY